MTSQKKFDQVISLGHRCYTANQLRRMMIHGGTMPFDWIISGADGVADAVSTRFEGMLVPERLSLCKEWILDSRFGFHHYHDFPITPDFMKNYDAVLQRRRQLVDRFESSLQSSKRLLFVRHELTGNGSLERANQLLTAIAKHRPAASFRLLYMTDTLPTSHSELLSVIKVRATNDLSDGEWSNAFNTMHSLYPIKSYFPSLVDVLERCPRTIRVPISQLVGNVRKRLIQASFGSVRLLGHDSEHGSRSAIVVDRVSKAADVSD